MTWWTMRYELSCGHRSGRVDVQEESKRGLGDTWTCPTCGAESMILKADGHGT